jgi:SGNH domain (fused to AT3 domains)
MPPRPKREVAHPTGVSPPGRRGPPAVPAPSTWPRRRGWGSYLCGVLPVLIFVLVAGAVLAHPQRPLGALRSLMARLGARQREALPRRGAIRPAPQNASADIPTPIREGCMIGITRTTPPRPGRCEYGDPRGRRTLILLGDSHAMQHFPALQIAAKRNRWRLLVLTKRECTPGQVMIHNTRAGGEYWQCDAWRQRTLRRIEHAGQQVTVAMSGDTADTAYGPHGEELSGRANAKALEAGYVATLRRIRHAGVRVVVIRDIPEAPFEVPNCVAEHLGDPRACDFQEPHSWLRNFDLRAARRVPGTLLIDPSRKICPGGLCRAVIGNLLVYRERAHLTATYARTLAPWFEARLKRHSL